uniref:Uncharacterized protein n=1 Tax=Oryza glumipatula TaxID=40148 RepID=A0A0E0AA93_9ORYZ
MQIVPYVPPVCQEVADQAQSPVLTQRTPPPTDSAPLTTEEVAAQDKVPDTVEDTLGVEAVRAIGIDPLLAETMPDTDDVNSTPWSLPKRFI